MRGTSPTAGRVCCVSERCGRSRLTVGRGLVHPGDQPDVRTTLQARQTLYTTPSDLALRTVLTYASAFVEAHIARSCHALRTLFEEKRDHLRRAIRCRAGDSARNVAADRAARARG